MTSYGVADNGREALDEHRRQVMVHSEAKAGTLLCWLLGVQSHIGQVATDAATWFNRRIPY